MANPGKRVDAFPAFHFEVTINGDVYPFRSCSGLQSETKFFEIEEGGVNGYTHKIPTQTTFPPLVLRQGFCDPSSKLYAMYQAFVSSEKKKDRFVGSVRQLGPNGTAARWSFKGGWISKWQGPELDATKNEVSIECIEIVHDGLTMEAGTPAATPGKSAGAAPSTSSTPAPSAPSAPASTGTKSSG